MLPANVPPCRASRSGKCRAVTSVTIAGIASTDTATSAVTTASTTNSSTTKIATPA